MVDILRAATGGAANVVKNRTGQWIGWRSARILNRVLRDALGEDADNVIDSLIATATLQEFGAEMGRRVLTDQMRGLLSPAQVFLLEGVLGNITEHVLPEFNEELDRLRELHRTDPDAARTQAGAIWQGAVERSFGTVLPVADSVVLRYISYGGNRTYYLPDSPAYREHKRALEAGFSIRESASGRGAERRYYDVDLGNVVYTEGDATLDEALLDTTGQISSRDFPLIERARVQSLRQAGGGRSPWSRLGQGERDRINDLIGRLFQMASEATDLAERAKSGGTDFELNPLQRFLADNLTVIRDSNEQMRDCDDLGQLRTLARIEWPDDEDAIPRTAYAIFMAIERVGGQASIDRRTEQSASNLRRWAQRDSRRRWAQAQTLVGSIASQRWFQVVTAVIVLLTLIASVTGLVIWVQSVFPSDLVKVGSAHDRVTVVQRGKQLILACILMLPLAGVLYLLNGVISFFGGLLKSLGRLASAVGSRVFGIEISEANAVDLFDQGRFFRHVAGSYLAVVCAITLFPLGTLEVDLFLCAHAISQGLRIAVPILILGAGLGKGMSDLVKGLSEFANQEVEQNRRFAFKAVQLIPAKVFVLLVIIAPLLLPIAHVLGLMAPLQEFQEHAIEYVDHDTVLMPTGHEEDIKVLGGKRNSALVCSNNRLHVTGIVPADSNDYHFEREWNDVLQAFFTGVELLKARVDHSLGHDSAGKPIYIIDGLAGVTLESAFPGATVNTSGLVMADPKQTANLEGAGNVNFVVGKDGFVQVVPADLEPSVVSMQWFSDFLQRTPGYAFWVLALALLILALLASPPKKSEEDPDNNVQRTLQTAATVVGVLGAVGVLIMWFVRSGLV